MSRSPEEKGVIFFDVAGILLDSRGNFPRRETTAAFQQLPREDFTRVGLVLSQKKKPIIPLEHIQAKTTPLVDELLVVTAEDLAGSMDATLSRFAKTPEEQAKRCVVVSSRGEFTPHISSPQTVLISEADFNTPMTALIAIVRSLDTRGKGDFAQGFQGLYAKASERPNYRATRLDGKTLTVSLMLGYKGNEEERQKPHISFINSTPKAQ